MFFQKIFFSFFCVFLLIYQPCQRYDKQLVVFFLNLSKSIVLKIVGKHSQSSCQPRKYLLFFHNPHVFRALWKISDYISHFLICSNNYWAVSITKLFKKLFKCQFNTQNALKTPQGDKHTKIIWYSLLYLVFFISIFFNRFR